MWWWNLEVELVAWGFWGVEGDLVLKSVSGKTTQ